MEQPVDFTIAVRDFDLNLLPEESREVGTEQFAEAVGAYFARQFEPMDGSTAVAVSPEEIAVSWIPSEASASPIDYAVSLLGSGRYEEAVPLLKLLLAANPDGSTVLYNLGLAQSDLGDMDSAVRHLTRATEIDPKDVNSWVALGVAQKKTGDPDAAIKSLEQAVTLAPASGYAQLNLGAVLAAAGRGKEAEHPLREAVRLFPESQPLESQQAAYGLARNLEQNGSAQQVVEAHALYQRTIGLNPRSDIAELARGASQALAERNFRQGAAAQIRMDAALYCLDGLRKFEPMSPMQVQTVAFEIGMLGARGLDINKPALQYTLRSLPGTFSGLHLMSLMYVGFKKIAPDRDIGFDLSNEYALAQQMFSEQEPAS